MTLGAAWVVVSSVAFSLASTIATGVLVGSVPGTIAGGFGSESGRRLKISLAIIGGIFVYSQVLEPFQNIVVGSLSRRVNGYLRARVMRVRGPSPGHRPSRAGRPARQDPRRTGDR